MALGRYVTALALASLATPVALADWSAFGSFEPSTPYDSPQWMFQDAPFGGQNIYFNVISTSQYPPATTNGDPAVNPNVGLLSTQVEPVASEYHVAILGVWVDCNGDGYIGMAETAVREYRSALLLDDSLCPAISGSPNRWTAGAHNYNQWVSELIPIARGTNLSADARVFRDDSVRVWGDFHRPDEKPFHRSCALRPFPRGTLTNVGGALNYVDCRQDLLGPWNDAMDLLGDPLGLRFADEDDARTGTLGLVPLLGEDDASHSAVTVADCEAPPAFDSGAAYNATGRPLDPVLEAAALSPDFFEGVFLPTLSPGPQNTNDPTLAGTANQTNEELAGDCDTSNDFGHDLTEPGGVGGLIEADFNGVNPNNKLEADWNFGFSTIGRGQLPLNLMPGGSGPAGVPPDAGIGMGGSRWVSDSTWLSKTGPRFLRVDLEAGSVTMAPAYWLSFYAHVGAITRDRGLGLPGGEGTYGAWHCGDNDSGIHNGWNCDASLWYINPDGTFPNDPDAILAKPGWSYHLRDVDCYDGRLGDTGIGIQPAFYGPEPCE